MQILPETAFYHLVKKLKIHHQYHHMIHIFYQMLKPCSNWSSILEMISIGWFFRSDQGPQHNGYRERIQDPQKQSMFAPYNAAEVRRSLGLATQTQAKILDAMEAIF
jgi:hypothetical protein